jgi:leader peptidase (prepilin peptidase)/N-methyltransferase
MGNGHQNGQRRMSATGGSAEWVAVGVAGLVGLFVGSFLNVVAYRAPLGLSVSTPRSFCPTCERQLAWWENVPLVSWLALRGRCHTCHEPISARYPMVEVTTAVTFALIAWAWHGRALSVGYCALAAATIAVGLVEYGGTRAPLSVGAAGVTTGQVLIVAAALWLEQWAVLGWSLVGLTAGTAVFAILRAGDPACRDQRWFGRSLLPVAGCWLGGLAGIGLRPVVAGLGAWILAALTCPVVLWVAGRQADLAEKDGVDGHGPACAGGAPGRGDGVVCAGLGCAGLGCAGLGCSGAVCGGAGGPDPGSVPWVARIAGVPLVTGIVVALAVSLSTAG